MRWDEDHESPDVIDKRGQEGQDGNDSGGSGLGGLFFLLPLMRSPFGWLVLVGLGIWFAVSRLGSLGEAPRRMHSGEGPTPSASGDEAHFVSFVLDDVQSTWSRIFSEQGRPYRHAKLVLFTNSTPTSCGTGRAATGPFYCPADERVYLDLAFYHELTSRLGVRGRFAEAYVIAHEVGHHVQNLLGIEKRAHGSPGATRGAEGSSVRLELQADCFAGVWARSTAQRKLLESGDIESALRAAAAVGDDRIQRMERGTVSPETWTHGSSEQRVRWFRRGYDGGTIASCDAFNESAL